VSLARARAREVPIVPTGPSPASDDQRHGALIDGAFTVLGKVTMSIPASGEPINLVRRSGLAKLPHADSNSILGRLAKKIDRGRPSREVSDWRMPRPTVQIVPLAIFV
jgi:hypothetical protein